MKIGEPPSSKQTIKVLFSLISELIWLDILQDKIYFEQIPLHERKLFLSQIKTDFPVCLQSDDEISLTS